MAFGKERLHGGSVFERAAGGVRILSQIVSAELALLKPQFILLVPVFMACGIGAYFSLSFEPPVTTGVLAAFGLLAPAIILRGWGRYAAVALFLAVLGFASAQIRTHLVYTPILAKKMDFAAVQGRIEAIEDLEKGVRVLLSDVSIEKLAPEQTPRKIRLKFWKGEGLQVGQRISTLAGLNPPAAPVMPRGFDFKRMMYFQGIGAVGFAYKTPEILEEAGPGFGFGSVEALRSAVARRIQAGLEAPASGLALALMIGQRQAIEESDMEAIRLSGLAHMLAISGLHVGLFSGVLFFASRFIMALFPGFALRHPIKKYAALFAMSGALFYMLIAGSSIPAQRAMITVFVVLCAVLLDRSTISLRVVAFAAFMILLLFPESLESVSFQMSFAAVTCLVAFYDWLRPVWSQWYRQAGFWRRAALYFVSVCLTSIVAGLATAPFSLFHFQTFASYGLLANMVCVPLLGLVVMPLAILSLLLMPFGFDALPLAIMEPALRIMLWVAHWVSGLQGAALRVPQLPFSFLMLCVLGVLSVIVFRARLRVIALGLVVIIGGLNFHLKQPDILMSSEFDLVAFRADEPYLLVSSRKAERFSRESWERSMGYEPGSAVVFPAEGALEGARSVLRCGEEGCRFEKAGARVSYLIDPDPQVIAQECAWADIVIAKHGFEACERAISLDKYAGYAHGAHAIYLEPALRIERVNDFRGQRPWVQ